MKNALLLFFAALITVPPLMAAEPTPTEKGRAAVASGDLSAAVVSYAAATKLGARKTLNTRVTDSVQQLQAAAQGNLAGAIDFVGMPATAALGIAALRKGGRYVICGLFGGELTHPLPPIAQRAIGIVGSYVGNLQELKEVVALAKKKKLKPTPVETRPAAQANGALEDLKAGKVLGRVVLDFETVAPA